MFNLSDCFYRGRSLICPDAPIVYTSAKFTSTRMATLENCYRLNNLTH